MSLLDGLEAGHFGCILADPPWNFRSYAQSKNMKSDRHVTRHYQTMDPPAIKALPVASLAAKTGTHLFLWTTGPHLPQALDTMAAWGFKYSGVAFTWIKLRKAIRTPEFWIIPAKDFHVGLGFTTRKNAEFCLLGRRGNARRNAKDVRELIIAPRREHSRKPDEQYERIERYCDGPRLELFGRQQRQGWTVVGDQAGKFDA